MLNIVLSFAQYERELTGERIRDKIEASKKKGMWMGGTIPLGYDAKEGKLSINKEESGTIKTLFELFMENESITETARELNKMNFTTKTWISNKGNIQKGKNFNKSNVRRIIENPLYAGKVTHKGKVYDGMHEPIIPYETWQKANQIIEKEREEKIVTPIARVNMVPILKGVMNCGICGSKMTPTYTSKGGVRYRYYLCAASHKGNNDACKVGRVPAGEIEKLVVGRLLNVLKKPEMVAKTISEIRGTVASNTVIEYFQNIEKVWDELFPVEQARIVNLLVKQVVIAEGLSMNILKKDLALYQTNLFKI